MANQPDAIVHLLLSDSTGNRSNDKIACGIPMASGITHSVLPERVTCEKCKKANQSKSKFS